MESAKYTHFIATNAITTKDDITAFLMYILCHFHWFFFFFIICEGYFWVNFIHFCSYR